MWICSRCSEKIDDGFDVCWNCGTDSSGNADASFEAADAPRDEPIIVKNIDVQRTGHSTLVVRNLNYGFGSIAGPLIWTFVVGLASIAVYFRLDPDQAEAKPYLLAILTVMFLFGCGKIVHALVTNVLHVEIDSEFVVWRIWGTTTYPLDEIESIEFENELRMSLWSNLSRGPQRIVTFVLRSHRDIRLAIDASFEKQLREATR